MTGIHYLLGHINSILITCVKVTRRTNLVYIHLLICFSLCSFKKKLLMLIMCQKFLLHSIGIKGEKNGQVALEVLKMRVLQKVCENRIKKCFLF